MKELSNEFVIEAVSTKMIKFYHSTRRATFKETIRGKGENSHGRDEIQDASPAIVAFHERGRKDDLARSTIRDG